MMKSALLCSAVCTALVLGAGLPEADSPNNIQLLGVLKPHVGKPIYARQLDSGTWFLSLRRGDTKGGAQTLVELSSENIWFKDRSGTTYIPLTMIGSLRTD